MATSKFFKDKTLMITGGTGSFSSTEELSKKMTQDFGKGFNVANLKNMRQFYLKFPNSYALRSYLSWTH